MMVALEVLFVRRRRKFDAQLFQSASTRFPSDLVQFATLVGNLFALLLR